MLYQDCILIILGSLFGALYSYSLIYIQKNFIRRSNKNFIIYFIRKAILLLILFYILHLFKIKSIIFIIGFILSFWTLIIKHNIKNNNLNGLR